MRVLFSEVMCLGRRFHGAVLAALLAAAVPVLAPWCDAWCLEGHHVTETSQVDTVSATGETDDTDHSHCLEMMRPAAAMAEERSDTASVAQTSAGLACRTLPAATSVDEQTADRLRSPAMQLVAAARPMTSPTSARGFVRDTGPSPPHPPPTRPLALRL